MSQLVGQLIKTLSLLGFDRGANHRFLPFNTVLVRHWRFMSHFLWLALLHYAKSVPILQLAQ
ncbi:hypothetical protein K5D43_08525 [Pseudomonas cichorii]|nr:hypothetical protein [Pseudomonas cichorii]MBX8554524.1 hypothetical protein [Pseudomonas cichorii]